MKERTSLIPVEKVHSSILLIRGQKVILDADLAQLYGTTTKRFNEQVRRNLDRFPSDFMFQLSGEEFMKLKTDFAAELARKLDALEKKYDKNFQVVFEAIRQLMEPPDPKKKQIGFHWETEKPAKKKAPAKKARG